MDEQTSSERDSGHSSARRELGAWLSGPRSASDAPPEADGFRGERLGLPENGPGSVAGFGRRLVALFIDWMSAYLVTAVVVRSAEPGTPTFSLVVLGVFAAEVWLLTSLTGASFGQRITGLRVAGLGGRRVSPLRALARTLLICLVVPAAFWDRDGRGLHDKAAGSVVLHA